MGRHYCASNYSKQSVCKVKIKFTAFVPYILVVVLMTYHWFVFPIIDTSDVIFLTCGTGKVLW